MSEPSASSLAASRGGASRRVLDALTEPRPEGWRDVLAAVGLGMLYTVVLLATVDGLGYARDEGFYFVAARIYERWFGQLLGDPAQALASVDAAWRANHEHPALVKSLFALSHAVQQRYGPLAWEGTSFRFPAMVLSGLAVGVTYLWGTRARSRLTGLVAAVSLAALPRFFFHAHLACFDAPIVALWTVTAYLYWRTLRRGGWASALAVGVAFGLALNTKHNAWFLPPVVGLHAGLIEVGHAVARRRGPWSARRAARARQHRRRALAALASMATVGPLLFWASWPWLWHDTWARLVTYADFHLHHVYYNMEFLGSNYFEPPMPRSYAFVMTLATVPAVTLLCFGWGAVTAARRPLRTLAIGLGLRTPREPLPADDEGADPAATALLWALAMAVQYGAWLSPTTPIFGGTKHWMTAYPFLALFAGLGLHRAVRHARHRWLERRRTRWPRLTQGPLLEAGFAVAVLVAPAVEAIGAHPFGLTSYSPLVGGTAGAATLGLNRGFWGYTTGVVVDYLNREAPPEASVYVHDTAYPAWQMLKRDGRLRADLRAARTVAGADFGLYHHEKHMSGQEYQNWVAFGTARPDLVAGLDGVPVIWVYRRPR